MCTYPHTRRCIYLRMYRRSGGLQSVSIEYPWGWIKGLAPVMFIEQSVTSPGVSHRSWQKHRGFSWGFHGATCWHFLLPRNPALRRWGDDKKYIIKTMSSRDLNALKGVIDAHPEEGMWGWFPTLPHKKEHVWTNVVNPCEDKTCAGIPMFPFIIYIYCSRLWCTADISSLKPWSKRRPQRDLWWTRLKCQGQKWSEHLRDSKHDDIDFPWETCSSSSSSS